MSRPKGFTHTQETINKISKAHLGKKVSTETKKRISIAKKGSVSPNKGKRGAECGWYKGGKRRRYCQECNKRIDPYGKNIFCISCSKLGNRHPFYGKKHSTETKKKIGDKSKGRCAGNKHPKWKGGITSQEKIERNKFRWYVQKKVFERDGYTCQLCGDRGVILHVDHIQKWSEYIQGRFDINNCRTVCRSCHYFITFNRQMPIDSKWGMTFSRKEAD